MIDLILEKVIKKPTDYNFFKQVLDEAYHFIKPDNFETSKKYFFGRYNVIYYSSSNMKIITVCLPNWFHWNRITLCLDNCKLIKLQLRLTYTRNPI